MSCEQLTINYVELFFFNIILLVGVGSWSLKSLLMDRSDDNDFCALSIASCHILGNCVTSCLLAETPTDTEFIKLRHFPSTNVVCTTSRILTLLHFSSFSEARGDANLPSQPHSDTRTTKSAPAVSFLLREESIL